MADSPELTVLPSFGVGEGDLGPGGWESSIDWRSFGYYPQLARVREHVETRLGQRITLGDAARIACLEYSYFSVFFRSKVNATFGQWLRVVRVRRAAELIRLDDVPIGRVAHDVGFGSVRTLERSFKQVIGVTPSEFKRAVSPGARVSGSNGGGIGEMPP